MTTELRRYVRTRVLLDYNAFLDGLGEDVLICTNKGILGILRVLIESYGRRRSNWVTQHTLGGYYSIDDAQANIVDQFISEFLGETDDMAICDDLATSLASIAAAIAAQGNCECGSSGAGGSEPPENQNDSGDITGITGTPPDGYPDWATYQQKKCDIAWWIVNNMISDMSWWLTISIADLTASALGVGMVSVLSGGSIILLFAALTGLYAYSSALLSTMKTAVEAGADDLVCALMLGTAVSGSKTLFETELEGIIDTAISDPIGNYLVKTVVSYFQDNSQFNYLYETYDVVLGKQIPAGQDCSSCLGGCNNVQMWLDYGTDLGGGDFQSVFADNAHRIAVIVNSVSNGTVNPCGPMQDVYVASITGHVERPGGLDFRVWEDDSPLTQIYNSDTSFEGQTFCCRILEVDSNAAFTMHLDFLGNCV